MPQMFQVLRCYKCLVFQTHQTKKSLKWECKLCGEKQSIKRHYGMGIARDCRIHVQKLNCLRGEIDELKCSRMERNPNSDEETEIENLEPEQKRLKVESSKWSMYVDPATEEIASDELMCLGDSQVVLDKPKKCKKKIDNHSTSNCNIENPSGPNANECFKLHRTLKSESGINAKELIPKVLPSVSNTITSNVENEQFLKKRSFNNKQSLQMGSVHRK